MELLAKIFRKVYGMAVTRTVQRFNVENRAERLLDSEQVRPPPKFEADTKLIEKLKQDQSFKDEMNGKDVNLVENMQKIVIKSSDTSNVTDTPKPENLPEFRGQIDLPEWGYIDPIKVPEGKLTISMFVAMLDMKYTEKKSNEEIAAHFKLNKNEVDNLLYYYKPFTSFKEGKVDGQKTWERKKLAKEEEERKKQISEE